MAAAAMERTPTAMEGTAAAMAAATTQPEGGRSADMRRSRLFQQCGGIERPVGRTVRLSEEKQYWIEIGEEPSLCNLRSRITLMGKNMILSIFVDLNNVYLNKGTSRDSECLVTKY